MGIEHGFFTNPGLSTEMRCPEMLLVKSDERSMRNFGIARAATVHAVLLFAVVQTSIAQDAPGSRTILNFKPATEEILRNPDPNDWLMMRGNYEMWAHSGLDQINTKTVGGLALVWARAMNQGTTQGTPLVYNGVMYLPNANDLIQAIDAATGDLIWEYDRPPVKADWDTGPIRNDRGARRRGIALYEDLIIYVARDNTLVALDARNGKPEWETSRGGDGYVSSGSPPVIADGIVITGSSCQDAPFGCYVTAHDVNTGEELWRNEVIPRPGQPGDETWGGMPFEKRWCTGVWGFITYDPVLNLVNYGSSGICPASETQRNQPGATLAGTNERWAVRPGTGEVVWHRQLLPRDNWDQECTFEMMVIETDVNPNPDAQAMLAVNPGAAGKRRTLTGMPCKNPVFWSLDAATGEFLYAKATWDKAQNLYATIDETGHATMNEDVVLKVPGQEYFFCTTTRGGRNWQSGSYDPERNLIIQQTLDMCTHITARADKVPTPRDTYNIVNRMVVNPAKENGFVGRIDAVNVATGETAWTWEGRASNNTPLLSTAGGLLFNGGEDRYFRAHDLDTGKVLWQTRLGSRVTGGAVSYAVNGRQYIAVVGGGGVMSNAQLSPEVDYVDTSDMVYVFALPEGSAQATTARSAVVMSDAIPTEPVVSSPAPVNLPPSATRLASADNADMSDQMKQGEALYAMTCQTCHGDQGQGGSARPLKANALLGDSARLVTQIVWGSDFMPPNPRISNTDLAAVATYIRNSFGNAFGPLSEEEAGKLR